MTGPVRARREDERGAVAVLTALLLALLLVVGAFAVDLGMQRVVRRDMQALADVVAFDLVRQLDGRTGSEILSSQGWSTAMTSTLARNKDTLGERPDVDAVLGTIDPSTFEFSPLDSTTQVPTAVRVVTGSSVPFAFSGLTDVESGSATRSATAMTSSGACFRLGSTTATIDTADSALLSSFGSLVGGALGVKLDAASYRGLADTFVGLADVAAELGVGSVEELVDLKSLSVSEFLAATARVLARDGSSDAAADAALVASLAARVSNTLRFDVGKILSVGGASALTAQAGVLDLIMASAFAINGENLLDTGVVWNEPHVSSGNVKLKLIETPRAACGLVGPATSASTAQVQLEADLGFNLPNKIGVFSVTNATNPTTKAATISVRARLGGATGYLSGLSCGDATSTATAEEIRAMIETRLSDVSVSLPFRLRGDISTKSVVKDLLGADPLNLGRLITAVSSVELSLNLGGAASASLTSLGSGPRETVYAVPPHTYSEGEPVPGSGPLQIPQPRTSVAVTDSTATLRITALGVLPVTVQVDVGTLDLTSILDSVTSSVIGTSTGAVVDNLNELLDPVSTLLGLRTGGADMFGIPRPSCTIPRLAG